MDSSKASSIMVNLLVMGVEMSVMKIIEIFNADDFIFIIVI